VSRTYGAWSLPLQRQRSALATLTLTQSALAILTEGLPLREEALDTQSIQELLVDTTKVSRREF